MASLNETTFRDGVRDRFDRPLRDLRISVIDNCNLRCTYCMPAEQFGEHYRFLPPEELLSFEEIDRAARAFVALGVTKLRLTGGEPLLRKDIAGLVTRLAAIDGVDDLALTTNGLLLARHAEALRAAGLKRLTISLDSIAPDVFAEMSGRKVAPQTVLDGIATAKSLGFSDIKLNAVVQRGVNDRTVMELVEYARDHDVIVRFIEYMDVGNRNGWRLDDVVTSKELLETIHGRYPLEPLQKNYHGEVAERYAYLDGEGEVGFISSVSGPFCGSCTRARLSADGKVFTCLFGSQGTDLRGLLRAGASHDELADAVAAIWKRRGDRYSELRSSATGTSVANPKIEMYQIGG